MKWDDVNLLTSKILPHLISRAKKASNYGQEVRTQLVVVSGLLRYLLRVNKVTLRNERKKFPLPTITMAGRAHGDHLIVRSQAGS